MLKLFYRSERGDTIVEVMIAMAIVGAMLIGGYNVVTRTTRNAQDVKERGEALRLLEGQIELLRSGVAKGSTSPEYPIDLAGKVFCYDNTGVLKSVLASGADEFTMPTLVAPPDADYEPACRTGQAGFYRLAIQETDPTQNVFKVQAVWDGVTGQEARAEIVYRVY